MGRARSGNYDRDFHVSPLWNCPAGAYTADHDQFPKGLAVASVINVAGIKCRVVHVPAALEGCFASRLSLITVTRNRTQDQS